MTKLSLILVFACCATAQEKSGLVQFDWSKLSEKAVESVNLNFEGATLEMAKKFLGAKGEEGKAKDIIQGLKGLFVRSLTFDKEGEYSESDVSAIRSQFHTPDWTIIVDVKEKKESTAIYANKDGSMVILAAEPKELTVVQILGKVDLSSLNDLSGLGIPKMNMGPSAKPKPSAPKKNDDD